MNELVILVCISNIECFGESVTEVVARTGLQCLSIMHQCLDRICCLCSCKLLFFSFLTLNHRDRQLIFEEICIYIQHLQRALLRFFCGRVDRMAFLPQELT